MTYRKKLIEVALPLDAINKASTRENYIYKGNPSAIHKWWAQRPLATSRAVLFSSLVDDPSSRPDEFPTEKAQEQERDRLFKLIEALVQWENSNNEDVLTKIRSEVLKSTDGNPPHVLDPFCGGGSIPLEAQRLGLEVQASDLNPVAVLITKALIDFLPRFVEQVAINPDAKKSFIGHDWHGTQGLADDIRYYGKRMRDEAERLIGHLYPKVKLPKEYGGSESTVIAWLWARTVTCPNPACGAQMPLVRSFQVSKKKGKETWVKPLVDLTIVPPAISFLVKANNEITQSGTINRQGALCVACNGSAPLSYIRTEAQAGRMKVVLLAIVAEGPKVRLYLSPTMEHEIVIDKAKPTWKPEELVTTPSHDVDRLPMYGMYTWGDAFTRRQLVALTTFSDLIQEIRDQVLIDASNSGLPLDGIRLNNGGKGATAYADAIATYLAFACDKYAIYGCALIPWYAKEDRPSMLFSRQAISMVWDFA
jgi:putative DNA methylase